MDSVTLHVQTFNAKSALRDVPGAPGLKWAFHVYPFGLRGGSESIAAYVQVVGGNVTVNATFEAFVHSEVIGYTKIMVLEFKDGELHGCDDLCSNYAAYFPYRIKCRAVFKVKDDGLVKNTDLGPVKLHELIDESKPHWTDTKIVVGKTDITVHRGFLSMISPVFNAMFSPETKESRTGTITITDFNAATVQNALDYCYGADLKVETVEQIIDMLRFYDKYDIQLLVKKLEAWLKANLTIKNFSPIAAYAWQYSREALQAECGRMIHNNKGIAFLPEFLALDPTVIASVLKAGLISTGAAMPADTL